MTAPRPPRPAGQPLVEVRDLVKHYAAERGWFGLGRPRPPVRAVDGVSFAIGGGSPHGLAWVSGSGKTPVGRPVARFLAADSGRGFFEWAAGFAPAPWRTPVL